MSPGRGGGGGGGDDDTTTAGGSDYIGRKAQTTIN